MTESEKRNNDRNLLLEVLRHRVEGSLHAQTNVLNVAYSLGFDTEYAKDLINYLKINGLIETDKDSFRGSLTTSGSRRTDSSEIAA